MAAKVRAPATEADSTTGRWHFRLYVAGLTPRSLSAFVNLRRLCEEHLAGKYRIEVVDLTDEPETAITERIVALPTVVRTSPAPARRAVGDLSDVDQMTRLLQLQPRLAG